MQSVRRLGAVRGLVLSAMAVGLLPGAAHAIDFTIPTFGQDDGVHGVLNTTFTAGIGVIIWVGQWRDFFGLPAVGGEHFHQKLWGLLLALPHLHLPTTLLACASLAAAVYGPRLPGLKRVPGPLIAMVAATAAQQALKLDGVATLGSAFGGIPHGLPHLVWPRTDFEHLVTLLPAAFTIAMLGAIESLLSAVVADGVAGTRH